MMHRRKLQINFPKATLNLIYLNIFAAILKLLLKAFKNGYKR